MAVTSISLFSAIAEKMRWHQQRQTLLAQNVANAETPGYVGLDLTPFSFAERMNNMSMAQVTTSVTSPTHMSVSSSTSDGFGSERPEGFSVTPQGNSVSLEDEMIKVTANQMDYQAVTTLYTRSLRLIRTALGRQA